MMNPMAIYLIRHGETPLNAKRVIQFPDTPLSDRGQAQARALGERLSTAPVGAIVTSDYQRAYMTADAVRKTTDAPMEIETTLRERNFGDLRGQAFADLDEDPFAPGYAPPNGETWDVFHERAASSWDAVTALAARVEGDVVAVTHGLVLRSLCAHVLSLGDGIQAEGATFMNTCLTRVEGPPWEVSLLACDLHLEGDLRATGGKV